MLNSPILGQQRATGAGGSLPVAVQEESPPKKPLPKRRELPKPMIEIVNRKKLTKDGAKRLLKHLNQIDSIMEEKLSSFQETMSGYGTYGAAGKNAQDLANVDVISMRSSKSSFNNYQMLNENLVYKKRRERKMNKSPDTGITTSALKKIRMYIDRNSQLSPQVKHKLNYFFENEGSIPLDELNNSFMNGMINKEQHE